MAVRIIAVGKKHETWVAEGIERYQKRLKKPFDAEWLLLPHSVKPGDDARAEESRRIEEKLQSQDFVVLLDERGTLYGFPALPNLLLGSLEASRRLAIVIGGAYGVDDALRAKADAVWSLSPSVFPHQMVRLMVIEQLYRVQEVAHHRPYHHE